MGEQPKPAPPGVFNCVAIFLGAYATELTKPAPPGRASLALIADVAANVRTPDDFDATNQSASLPFGFYLTSFGDDTVPEDFQ